MKTVRFSSLLEAAGEPEIHLLLTAPAQDRELQKALKENRVLTLVQEPTSTRSDYGVVGLEQETVGQVLIFPKSLKAYVGSKVIGIKYEDLVEEMPEEPLAPKEKKALPPPKSAPKEKRKPPKPAPTPEKVRKKVEAPSAEALLKAARIAMRQLEEGKQVAAFNTLKEIAGP